MIHTVKGFGIVIKAEIDVFLELSSFFGDSADVGKRDEIMYIYIQLIHFTVQQNLAQHFKTIIPQ